MSILTITDVRPTPGDSAFLLDDGTTAILCDTGFGFTGAALVEKLRCVLGDRTLDYILLTHSHYDHALGTPYVVRAYPDVQVVAGSYARTIFAKPTARAAMADMDRKAARNTGAGEYEDLTGELKVDLAVEDGQTFFCGSRKVVAIALPGHTKCSLGYYFPEEKLLAAPETLGVFFGDDIYLPSCLVGYEMTLESIRKAGALDLERILVPHYGEIGREEAKHYLQRSDEVVRETARTIMELYGAGKTTEEIVDYFTETSYSQQVAPAYPIDAFRLNTGIMAQRIRKELEE